MATKKSNPVMKPKKNKWIKANAIKFNRNGTVSIKTQSNPRNVAAGVYGRDGVFHPFRSSSDYDPDRAGDEYGARTDNEGSSKYRKKKKATAKRKSKAKAKRRK